MNSHTADKISVGLYIRGTTLDPDAITSLLGVQPNVLRRAGDVYTSVASGKSSVAKDGLWAKVVDSDGGKAEDVLDRLLADIPSSIAKIGGMAVIADACFDVFIARMAGEKGRMDMEINFADATLARLAATGLPLRITIAVVPE